MDVLMEMNVIMKMIPNEQEQMNADTFKNNWKLTCLSLPMNDVYDFVDAPLVT